jgi:hypothetical protein
MLQATLNSPATRSTSPEIKDENFRIQFAPETQTVIFQGELQFCGITAYAPVIALLDIAIHQTVSTLCLDLRDLKFLNSSGIYMLLRFVLKVRNQRKIQLVVKGSNQVSWQSQSLPSLKQIMPQLDLHIDASQ